MWCRLPAHLTVWAVAAIVLGACGAPQGPLSGGSGATPVREPSALPSGAESQGSQGPCPRPDVRAASQSPGGGPTLRYEVERLGLPERSTSSAYALMAINDAGQVVGTADGDVADRGGAYRWTPGRRVDFITGAQGQETRAHSVNSSGQVAGDVWVEDDGLPFVWDQRTGLRALHVAVGPEDTSTYTSTYEVLINDRGQVSGTLETYDGDEWTGAFAFRMEPEGTVSTAPLAWARTVDMNGSGEVLITVEDDTGWGARLYVWQSGATLIDGGLISTTSTPQINDAGLVVGATATPVADGDQAACGFAWDTRTGRRTILGLGVVPHDVNQHGEVTGVWDDGDVRHAFVWDSSGFTDLGTVPGYKHSSGAAINDHGQVIGFAERERDWRGTHFLWDPGAGLIELRPLHEGDSTFVAGINNAGKAVGLSGPLDPEEGVVTEGAPVIWHPTG